MPDDQVPRFVRDAPTAHICGSDIGARGVEKSSQAHQGSIGRDWVAGDVSPTCGGGAAIGVVTGGSGFEEEAAPGHHRSRTSLQAQGVQSHHRNAMNGLDAFGGDSRP